MNCLTLPSENNSLFASTRPHLSRDFSTGCVRSYIFVTILFPAIVLVIGCGACGGVLARRTPHGTQTVQYSQGQSGVYIHKFSERGESEFLAMLRFRYEISCFH